MAVQLGHLQYPSQSGMPALFTDPELIAPFKTMCLLIPVPWHMLTQIWGLFISFEGSGEIMWGPGSWVD